MTKIERNLKKCSDESYDLVIVGGGIYGVMLSYEAARRNLRSIMLEKNDFINATSLNHLRTVHGGLRYLQSLDLPRFKESVTERKWYLQYFPQYVTPMPCLMPLYGKGVYRNPILRAGIILNDILSFNRNKNVTQNRHLPNGKILYPKKIEEVFPKVDKQGLKGGAVWYDANIEEFQRLMMEVIKTATASGATVLNYVEARELLKTGDNTTAGVRAKDTETNEIYEFKAPKVINAAGPWSRDMADAFDKDHYDLFKKRLLLWNVLFDREALSKYALGLSTKKGGGHTYFFHPWKNRLLVGTGEIVVEKNENETTVPRIEMEKFIGDLNNMVPELNLSENDVQKIYSGVLPAKENGSLANREVIFDHGINNGPKGLYSISGVKFTTARLVADKTLSKMFPQNKKQSHDSILQKNPPENLSFNYDWTPNTDEDLKTLKDIIDNESVLHLPDLLLRRTSLADNPKRALEILPKLKPLFDYNDTQWNEEIKKLKLIRHAGPSEK